MEARSGLLGGSVRCTWVRLYFSRRIMVITRTPYRISFFGGGTDYPAWYLRHGGSALACAINKYCYLTVRYLPPFFQHRYRLVYSVTELCSQISEIKHGGVRAVLEEHLFDRGVEIHHDGDLPARSGVGSSSSFTVGLLNAVNALKGRLLTRMEVATEAIRIEQEVLMETVGVQDQIMASFGGLQHLRFDRSGNLAATPVFPPPERMRHFEGHLMLVFTGQSRNSSEIAKQYVPALLQKEQILGQYNAMVEEGIQILHSEARSMKEFGSLLHEGWQLKRSLSPVVSNPAVDLAYEVAMRNGALGGKLLGAGGGGFLMLFAPPECHSRIREGLGGLIEVPVAIEHSGSQVIFFDRQQDYAEHDGMRHEQYK